VTESSVAVVAAVLSIVAEVVAVLLPQAIKKILKAMKLMRKPILMFFFIMNDLYKVRISMKMGHKIMK
jgi:hypothetical protein